MRSPHVLVLEREPLIADDMREEVLALSDDAVVEHATTIRAASDAAGRMPHVDLLILSNRSTEFARTNGYRSLIDAARAILLIGDAEDAEALLEGGAVHLARTPFTSASLREDLQRITVDGEPLFPQRCPG